MHSVTELVDAARVHANIQSDYRLAKTLDVTTHTVANWRHGRSKPDDLSCVKLANLAGLDPIYALSCVQAARATSPDVKTLWLSMASRFQSAGAALGCAVFALALMGSQPAESSMLIDDSSHGQLFPTQVDTGNISANVAFLLGLVLLAAVANFKRVFCLISDNSPVL